MDSNLVIKVNYGDTLRRFSVSVNGNGSVDVGMAGIETKIRNLFKFTSDDDITLTYKDEDQDVITLVDDDDLRDAIKQRLNPLRINLQLKTNTTGTFDTRSSGWSTDSIPKSSQQGQGNPLSHINSAVTEALKSLPEPLGDVLSKLSFDLASKAVSSAPVLTELLEHLTKFGVHPPVPVSESWVNDSDSSVDDKVTEGLKASTNLVSGPEVLHRTKSFDSAGTSNAKEGEVDLNGKSSAAGSSVAPTSDSLINASPTPVPDDSSYKSLFLNHAIRRKHPRSSAHSNLGFSPKNSTPISGMAGADSSNYTPPAEWSRRGYSHRNSMGRIFHKGICCDGCGAIPITGPRFKSKVREDYDLCSTCFSEIGNEAEYTRIDCPRPIPFPSVARFSTPRPDFSPPAVPLIHEHNVLCHGKKLSRPRNESLDCCFVHDVNIPDGYVISPDTPFTKIWRMRNNGGLPWPCRTQLVWIGGNQLTTSCSVSLKIAANGCPVGQELDVAVQFISPGSPGRYISYWGMQSPSGQKFGQCVWVLIQVDTSRTENIPHDSLSESIKSLNLNLPPNGSDEPESSQMIDMNFEPLGADKPECMQSNRNAESVKSMVDEEMKDGELDFPIDDTLICSNSDPFSAEVPTLASSPATSLTLSAEALASYPAIDSSVVPSHVTEDALSVNGEANDSNTVEETLLKELENMGFKQGNLNKEILRSNEYNLEQSVDDLCDVSDWDPILEELQEMGFSDNETNKRLLIKNGGSIKHVVMDLVAGERSA